MLYIMFVYSSYQNILSHSSEQIRLFLSATDFEDIRLLIFFKCSSIENINHYTYAHTHIPISCYIFDINFTHKKTQVKQMVLMHPV